jgi:hypothetical protein
MKILIRSTRLSGEPIPGSGETLQAADCLEVAAGRRYGWIGSDLLSVVSLISRFHGSSRFFGAVYHDRAENIRGQ